MFGDKMIKIKSLDNHYLDNRIVVREGQEYTGVRWYEEDSGEYFYFVFDKGVQVAELHEDWFEVVE